MLVLLLVMVLMLMRDVLLVYDRMMFLVYDFLFLDDNRLVMMMYMLHHGVCVLLDLLVNWHVNRNLLMLLMAAKELERVK